MISTWWKNREAMLTAPKGSFHCESIVKKVAVVEGQEGQDEGQDGQNGDQGSQSDDEEGRSNEEESRSGNLANDNSLLVNAAVLR
jgi:hypothetical protein